MSSRAALSLLFALLLAAPPAAHAQARRPTPRQQLDEALAPYHAAVQLSAMTDAERALLTDLDPRAETLAAALVEARHRHDDARAALYARMLLQLAHLGRARLEGARLEAQADEREHAVTELHARRDDARAALTQLLAQRARGAHAGTP